jgi:glycosyltransferase involved in cell wall biosynthesis
MDPQQARALLGWSEDRRYVLFPGNPEVPVKGFALARDSAAHAAEQAKEPLDLVPLWGVAPNQVPIYMNACQVLLLTSFSEGSPNVVKEAMACNLPVVSVPVGDVADLLSGVEGCAVRPRDVEELSKAIIEAVNRGQRTDGRIALERKGLDQESVARRIISLYEKTVTEKQKKRFWTKSRQQSRVQDIKSKT